MRIYNSLPVVGHRESNLKFGKKLEVLLLGLLGEARSYQQHLHDRHHYRKSASSSPHKTTQKAKKYSMFFCNLSSPWGPQLGSLHSWPQSERTWGAWSSPGILTATQDTGSREYTGRGWCQGSAAGSRSLSRSWWLDVVAKKRRVIKTWCFFMNSAVKGVTISQTLGRPTGIWIQR